MNWNPFKNKNTVADPVPSSPSVHDDGTIVEPPFFNVMPKKGVLVSAGVEAKTVPMPKLATPLPKARDLPTSVKEQPRVAPSADGPIFKAPPIVASDVSGASGVLARKHMVVAIVVLVLALLGIGFSVFIFSSHSNFASNVRNAVSALFGKKPDDAIVVTPLVPTPTPKLYNTSEQWRTQYFGTADCSDCEDTADPDSDSSTNQEEFSLGTDPKKNDTDSDGLADGDEVKVFACSPTNAHSAQNEQYSDGDAMKGGWDCNKVDGLDALLSTERVADISSKASQFNLHEPTLTTLGSAVSKFGVTPSAGVETEIKLPEGTDASSQASLERDVQRLNTIKKIGEALLAYRDALKTYPAQSSFADMALQIKPYNLIATNTSDPINVVPLVYGYELSDGGNGFALTYFSETQKQLIRYSDVQAKQDADEQARLDRDAQRMEDLDKIRSALLIYSATVATQNQIFVFPSKNQYQAKLAPQYIQVIPHDPQTQLDYPYEVSKDSSSFTLKAILEEPAIGTTGYACDQEGCKAY